MFRPSIRQALSLVLPVALTLAAGATAAHAADAPPPGAQAPASGNDPVVAIVNGEKVMLSQLLAARVDFPDASPDTPLAQMYPMLMDDVVRRTLVGQAAAAAHIGDSPAVAEKMAAIKPRVVTQVYFEGIANAAVTDKALHDRYQALLSKFHPDEDEIDARHILVQTKPEALAIIAQLNKGADFAKLAEEKSRDKSSGRHGGDLGYFTKDMMVDEFSEAAFKLKNKGDYTHTPVQTGFGWHVIQLLDRRKKSPPAFDRVKDELRKQIEQETVRAKMLALQKSATVQEFKPDGSPMPVADATLARPPTAAQQK